MQLYIGPGRLVIASYADELRHLPLHGRPTWLATVIGAGVWLVVAFALLALIAYVAWAGDDALGLVVVLAIVALQMMRRGGRR